MDTDKCYRILGVPSDSDLSEVKFAFRRLALEYHPDRNKSPEAMSKFNEITEAYRTLSGSHRIHAQTRVDRHKDIFDHAPGRKLTFVIFRGSNVVHSVSPERFEREVRRHFNPKVASGTFCEIGGRSFQIDIRGHRGVPLFGRRSDEQSLIEWYKVTDGTDEWKSVSWNEFWSYVHQFAT